MPLISGTEQRTLVNTDIQQNSTSFSGTLEDYASALENAVRIGTCDQVNALLEQGCKKFDLNSFNEVKTKCYNQAKASNLEGIVQVFESFVTINDFNSIKGFGTDFSNSSSNFSSFC